jgi:hypothetical protein
MRNPFWMAALAAVLLPVSAAAGAGVSEALLQGPTPLTNLVGVGPATLTLGSGASVAAGFSTPLVSEVRYRPRGHGRRLRPMPVTTQIHGGIFDPTDNFSTGFNAGFRIGPQVDPHVQIGLALDWWHKGESERVDLGSFPVPGGSGTEQLIVSRSSLDLVPILAFVQLSGDENLPIIPYVGAGLGYEFLFLSADDYLSGVSYDETFGGFGWQIWGGAGIPLSGRTRINGEVFYNGAEVGSDMDIYVPDLGYWATVRDVLNMDGIGMRVGLSWGF